MHDVAVLVHTWDQYGYGYDSQGAATTLAEQMRAGGYVTARLLRIVCWACDEGWHGAFDYLMEYPVIQRHRTMRRIAGRTRRRSIA
jgi:hypothetical protein